MVAFWGMHVSPAKHTCSYVWLPKKCDYCTDTQTDGWMGRHRTKWSLHVCAAMLRRQHKKYANWCCDPDHRLIRAFTRQNITLNNVNGLIFVGTTFCSFHGGSYPQITVHTKKAIFCMISKGKNKSHKFRFPKKDKCNFHLPQDNWYPWKI